jgi:predicted  nucleic acid-binding Zn-ribbon protein
LPHKCLECKNLIEGGKIDLQKGCPICGGKKFQYVRPKKDAPSPPVTVAEYVDQAAFEEPPAEAVSAAPARDKPAEGPGRQPGEKAEPPVAKPKPAKEPRGNAKTDGERIESIRLIEQGSYDINLPVLLGRKELIMSREEGNYVVDLSSALKGPKKLPRKKKK